ncbi:MAG: hypothetical protein AB7O56_08960 [Bauldia sp.]
MASGSRGKARAVAVADAFRRHAMIGAALLLPLLVLFAGRAVAQDMPFGVAFYQAEEGTWACREGDPETAFECAREACFAGAGGQDCIPTAWCFPAGYAGTLTLFLPDFHTTHPICGAPSLEALIGAMQAFCDHSPETTACYVGQVWDWEGRELTDFPGELIPGATPAAPPTK